MKEDTTVMGEANDHGRVGDAEQALVNQAPAGHRPPGFDPSRCSNCGGNAWVCENHPDQPWEGVSPDAGACGCGAGAPCPVCNLRMAAATYSEPWRELALRAISYVADAEKDTNWGQPTFGPTYSEELEAVARAISAGLKGIAQGDPS